mgnify:FL=1
MKTPKKYLDLYERDQLLDINKCTKDDLLLTWDEHSYTFKYKDQILLHKPRNQEEEILIRKFMDIYSELFEGIDIRGQTFKLEYPYLHISHPLVSEKVLLDGFFISKVMKIAGNAGLDILADKLALPYSVNPKLVELIDWGNLNIHGTCLMVSPGFIVGTFETVKQAKYAAATILFSRYSKMFTHNERSDLLLLHWDKYKSVKTNLRELAKLELEQGIRSEDSSSFELSTATRALLSIYKSNLTHW